MPISNKRVDRRTSSNKKSKNRVSRPAKVSVKRNNKSSRARRQSRNKRNNSKRLSRKRSNKSRNNRRMRGGTVLPSEYFGNVSGKYHSAGSEALKPCARQFARSQGVIHSDGLFAGPILQPKH